MAKILDLLYFTEAILSCQARSRIEERLEVTLTGAVPSVASAQEFAKLRAVSPLDKRPRSARSQSDGVIVEGEFCIRFF